MGSVGRQRLAQENCYLLFVVYETGLKKLPITPATPNGPVEGQINRLKMVKRQMFGRAHLDLLSRRFVGAPGQAQARAHDQLAPVGTHAEAEAA